MGHGRHDLRAVIFSIGWLAGGCHRVESTDGIALTILSPKELDHAEGAIRVVFHVDGNNPDSPTTVGAVSGFGAAEVSAFAVLAPGVSDGELTLVPETDSGYQRLAFSAWFDEDPADLTLPAEQTGDYTSEYVGVVWHAPWQARILDCTITGCPELAAGATFATTTKLAVLPRHDGKDWVGAELTINGVPVEDLEPLLEAFKFDVADLPEGPVTVAGTVLNADGERSTVTQQVDVANCPVAEPDDQYSSAVYTTGGLMFTAANALTRRDLRDHTVTSQNFNQLIMPLVIDEPRQRIYFGLPDPSVLAYPGVSWMSIDGLSGTMGVAANVQVLGMAVAPDGVLYWTVGRRGGTPAGAIFRETPFGGLPTRVDVGGVPAADGLLFDDDGTLLVTAGASIVRLTLTAGLETARTTVLTRAGATLTQLALDDQHRIYVVDKAAGELLRYTDVAAAPEVLYTQLDWANNEPHSISFVKYPPHCHGLLVTREGLSDARRMVDVGPVRGRP